MRIGLVVDAAGDLPPELIREYRIEIMPVVVKAGEQIFLDTKDLETTISFYRNFPIKPGQGETRPVSIDEVKSLFLDRLVHEYDFVFFLTASSAISAIHENALEASLGIISEYKARRAATGTSGPFVMRVIDTQVLFGAQSIATLEAARMIRAGAAPAQIEQRLNALIPNVYGYIVANNLVHIYYTARKRGEYPVSWLGFMFARLLSIKPVLRVARNSLAGVAVVRKYENANSRLLRFAAGRIRAGLLTPLLGLGYTGDFSEVKKIPGYDELLQTAKEAGVEIFTAHMGMVAGCYLGKDVVGITFAAPEHRFK
jgi:DegV family protein with EDD domain